MSDLFSFSFLGLSVTATAVIAGFYTIVILRNNKTKIGPTHIHIENLNVNIYESAESTPARRRRILRRLLGTWVVAVITLLSLPSSAHAEFGLSFFDISFANSEGGAELRAGAHPESLSASLEAITEPGPVGPIPSELLKDITVTQIPGLAGDLTAVPRCATLDFVARPPEGSHGNSTGCPNSTAVGFFRAVAGEGGVITDIESPVYNLEPPPGKVARLGLFAVFIPLTIDIGLSETFPYSPYAEVTNATQVLEFVRSELTVWGVPADPSHDKDRGTCMKTGKSCSAGVSPRPFLTMPRSCEGPLKTTWKADSWLHPGDWKEGFSLTHDEAIPPNPAGMRECGKLAFDPATSARPSTNSAESATGLDFEIKVADEGLKNPTGTAKADIAKAVIELPAGVTANPSAAEGLGVCSLAQYEAESLTNRACPTRPSSAASKPRPRS